MDDSRTPNLMIQAAGNQWRPNVQGADADGHYAPQLVERSTDSSSPRNFWLPSGSKIQF